MREGIFKKIINSKSKKNKISLNLFLFQNKIIKDKKINDKR